MIHDVRRHFHGYDRYWTHDWYRRHPGGWYAPWIAPYRWWYRPTWIDTCGWFGSGFFFGYTVGSNYDPYPYYYGNNIVYRGDTVYVNGVPYVDALEYYRQALELARLAEELKVEDPPREVVVIDDGPRLAPPEQDEAVPQRLAKPAIEKDWLPMGTFTFLDEAGRQDEHILIQLATNKEGLIRGNYVDEATDTVRQIVGAVDPKTQRVALQFTDDDELVLECGLWNLTQDTVPLLIHVDKNRTEERTLVRLQDSAGSEPPVAP